MSETLEARAEVLKLARLLAVEPAELEFLEDLPPDELRRFREQATDRLFDAGARALARVGAAAKLVPSGLAATIAERSFGPLLCARAAGAVDTDKAIDVAKRLPAEFLADVTVELDPRRVAAIIAEVPEALVVPVARELGEREEYVTMGRFIAYVPDHAIAAAIGTLSDEAMLRTAFVLEDKDRIDHAIGLLPPERVPGILRDASRLGIWPEALDLLDHLSDERRGPIADVVADLEGDVVAELVRGVHEAGLWDALLPVVQTMSDEPRQRLAAQVAFHDEAVLRDILRAAAAQGLWRELVPLVDAVPPEVRVTVARVAAELEPDLLAKIVAEAADAPETIPTLLGVLHDMKPESRARIIGEIDADGLIARQDETVMAALVAAVSAEGLWDTLLPIVRTIGTANRERLATMAAFHERRVLGEIVGAAAKQGLWRDLVPLVEALPAAALMTVTAVIDDADKRVADDLVAALDDDGEARDLFAAMPDEIAAAIRRAAERHGHEETLARILAAG